MQDSPFKGQLSCTPQKRSPRPGSCVQVGAGTLFLPSCRKPGAHNTHRPSQPHRPSCPLTHRAICPHGTSQALTVIYPHGSSQPLNLMGQHTLMGLHTFTDPHILMVLIPSGTLHSLLGPHTFKSHHTLTDLHTLVVPHSLRVASEPPRTFQPLHL